MDPSQRPSFDKDDQAQEQVTTEFCKAMRAKMWQKASQREGAKGLESGEPSFSPVSYTHLTLPTTPYV